MTRDELQHDFALAGLELVRLPPHRRTRWETRNSGCKGAISGEDIHDNPPRLCQAEAWWRQMGAWIWFQVELVDLFVRHFSAATADELDAAIRWLPSELSLMPPSESGRPGRFAYTRPVGEEWAIPPELKRFLGAVEHQYSGANPDGTFHDRPLSGRGWRKRAIEAWRLRCDPASGWSPGAWVMVRDALNDVRKARLDALPLARSTARVTQRL